MHTLMACLHQTEPEHRVLAASLLLQLDIMVHTLSAVLDASRLNKHLRSKLLKNHKGTSKKTPLKCFYCSKFLYIFYGFINNAKIQHCS